MLQFLKARVVQAARRCGWAGSRLETRLDEQYRTWCSRRAPEAAQLAAWQDEVHRLAHRPTISLLLPAGRASAASLRHSIESLRRQIYDAWELWIVGDCRDAIGAPPALDSWAPKDPRIKWVCPHRRPGASDPLDGIVARVTGEFVGLIGPGDELAPHAFYRLAMALEQTPSLDLLYTDQDTLDGAGRRRAPEFKPDWSPDLLRSFNYVGRLWILRTALLHACGGFRDGYEASRDYDLLLRATELTDRIARVADVLYHAGPSTSRRTPRGWRRRDRTAVRSLSDSLRRRGTPGRVRRLSPGRYVVRYRLRGRPLVSILVGMRDRWELTARCIRSIERKTAYEPYEIIVVNNQSAAPAAHRFLRAVSRRHRVVNFDEQFNYSALNNAAAATARGDHLVLLNNDTEVIGRDWLVAMLEHSQRPEVGAVGARLLYPDGRLQHAGVFIMGTASSVAGHAFRSFPRGSDYLGRIGAVGNWSAVTGACLMTRRDVFQSMGGLDERYRVAFGDVDFCLRVRESGRLVVYTPFATLLHLESATRGLSFPAEDEEVFRRRWARFFGEIADPYWNPNLSVHGDAFGLAV